MAIFGGGSIMPFQYGTPGILDGSPQAGLPRDPRIPQAVNPKGVGGMFGGGKLATILGVLGDSLTRQPTYINHLLQQRQQQQEDERWQKRFDLQSALKGVPTPSSAAKMAGEIGLQPGTPEYQNFIRRYAFKPTILSVGNALGGEDKVEYDPSGLSGPQTVGGVTYYNVNGEWFDNPEGR